jgi:tape measure domain-containing protein
MPANEVLTYTADTSDLEKKLNNIKVAYQTLSEFLGKEIEVPIHVEDAIRQAQILQAELKRLAESTAQWGNVKIGENLKTQIEAEVGAIRNSEQQLRGEFKDTANFYAKSSQEMVAAARSNAAAMVGANKQTQGSVEGLNFTLLDFVRTLRNIYILNRSAQFIKELGQDSLDTSVEFEAMKNSFTAVLHSSTDANKALAELRDTADTLGINFQKLTENFLRVEAAGKAAGFTADATKAIFEGVAVASTAMQLSTAETSRVFTAFEQVMSKGVLSAEEIRRQLGNALPGAFALTARALGVSTSELEKMFRAGQVLSNEALPKIAAEMVKTFGPAAVANVTSTRAEFARFENQMFDIKKAIGDGLKPVVLDIIRGFDEQDKGLKNLTQDSNLAAITFRDLAGAFVDVTKVTEQTKKSNDEFLGHAGSLAVEVGGAFGTLVTGIDAAVLGMLHLDKQSEEQTQRQKQIKTGIQEIVEEIRIQTGLTQSAGDVAVDYNSKAQKKVDELAAAYKKLSEQQAATALIGNITKDIPPAFEGAAKSINDLAISIGKYFKEINDNHTALDPQVVQFYAEEIARLRTEFEKAGKLTPAFKQALDDLANAMGGPAVVAATNLSSAMQELGIKTERQLQAAGEAVVNYVEAIESAGPATTDQADIIIKNIKQIDDSLKALPADQQAANQDLINSLDKIQQKYASLTTEAIKEVTKQKEEVAKQFREMSQSVGDIFDKLHDKIKDSLNVTGDAAKSIKDLQKEYDELGNQVTLTTEDFNRQQEILLEIDKKQEDVASEIKTAFSNSSQEIGKAFEDLILHNDNLIKGLALLPDAARTSALAMIRNFDDIAKSGGASEDSLKDFGLGIAKIFSDAGVPMAGFIAQIKGTDDVMAQLAARVGDLKSSGINELFGGEKESSGNITATADAVKNLGNQWHFTAQEIQDAINYFKDNNDLLIADKDNVLSLADATDKYGSMLTTVDDSLSQFVQSQKDVTDVIKASNNEVTSAGTVLSNYVDTLDMLDNTAGKTDETMNNVSDTFEHAQDSVKGITFDTDQLTASAVNQRIAFDKNKAAIQGLASRQDEFNASLEGVDETASNMVETFANTSKASANLGKELQTAGKEGAKGGKELADSMGGVEEKVKSIDNYFDNWINKKLPAIAEAVNAIKVELDAAAAEA